MLSLGKEQGSWVSPMAALCSTGKVPGGCGKEKEHYRNSVKKVNVYFANKNNKNFYLSEWKALKCQYLAL